MIFPQNLTEKEYRVREWVYRISLPLISLSTFLFGVLAFCLSADEQGRYLEASPLTILFYLFLGLGIFTAISPLFILPRHCDSFPSHTKASHYLRILPALGSLICVLRVLLEYIAKANNSFSLPIMLCGICAILYHLAGLIKLPKSIVLLFGYVQIAFCILMLSQLYFDVTVEMNRPVKLMLQCALAAIILDTLAELCPMVGRRSCGRRTVLAQGFVLTLCLAAAGIGLFSALNGTVNLTYGCYAALCLLYGLYSISKLFFSDLEKSEPEDDTVPDPTDDTPIYNNEGKDDAI